MSKRTKEDRERDLRPHILNYQGFISGIDIGAKDSILWPCHAFSVSLPAPRKRTMNIFEETILKMAATGKRKVEELSKYTCFPEDLVTFVVNKLQQFQLLNNRNEITSQALELFAEWEKEPVEYQAINVFVELIKGHLLPAVTPSQLAFEKLLESKGSLVKFGIGSTGQVEKYTARKLKHSEQYFTKILHPTEIANAVQANRKLRKHYSLLYGLPSDIPKVCGQAEAITVSSEARFVFLHCRIIVQKGSNDFYITDPFGYGISSLLSDIFRKYLKNDKQAEERVIFLKEKAISKQIGHEENNKTKDVKLPMFCDKINMYPQIKQKLVWAEIKWKDCKKSVRTSEEEKQYMNSVSELSIALYEALEWTLRLIISDYPVDNWEKLFASRNYRENAQIVSEMARKIGLKVSKNHSFLKVPPGKIRAVSQEGKVELQALLVLAIAGAAQNARHPLCRLAKQMPLCLDFFDRLKKSRDPGMHGEVLESKVTQEMLEQYRKKVHEIIQSLLPNLQNKGEYSDIDSKDTFERPIDNRRQRADIVLNKFFGVSSVVCMDADLREQLLQVELLTIDWKPGSEEIECREMVRRLAGVLQKTIFQNLESLEENDKHKGDLRQRALEKARVFELNKEEKFPDSINKVNLRRIAQSCQGTSQTLGADLFALLLTKSEEYLHKFAGQFPDLILLVGNICELRGHGNCSIHMSVAKALDLKQRVYKIVDYLKEV